MFFALFLLSSRKFMLLLRRITSNHSQLTRQCSSPTRNITKCIFLATRGQGCNWLNKPRGGGGKQVGRFLYTINAADQISSVKITHQTLIKVYILGLKDVSTISKAWNNSEYILQAKTEIESEISNKIQLEKPFICQDINKCISKSPTCQWKKIRKGIRKYYDLINNEVLYKSLYARWKAILGENFIDWNKYIRKWGSCYF